MSDREDADMANGDDRRDYSRSPARSASLDGRDRSVSPAQSPLHSRSRSPARSVSRDRSPARRPASLSRSPVARGVSRSRSRERSLSIRRSLSRERKRRSPSPYERRRSPPPRRRSPSPYRYRSRSRDRGYGGYGRRRSPPRYRSPPRRRSPYGGYGGYGGGGGGGYGRRRTPPPPRRRRTPPATGLHLFVAGLNFNTTEKEVQRKFEKYGDVTLSRIVRNPVNGESRGFGFVDMKDDDGADEAIKALDGEEWHGRRLLVERARNVR